MTVRDLDVVTWIGRIGAATVSHVMARFGLSRSVAYDRVAVCLEARLLRRTRVLHRVPALLVATDEGLQAAGLALSAVEISPSLATHHHVCAEAALWLEGEYGRERLLSVRELTLEERVLGRPIASAKVGELPSGAPQLHRPDFVIVGDGGAHAIEVELTAKAPARLDHILRGWRRSERVRQVSYLCAPGVTMRAVEAAVKRTRTAETVRVLNLEELWRR